MSFLLAGKPDAMHLHMGINDMHFWTSTNGTPAAGAAALQTLYNSWCTSSIAAGACPIFTNWPSYNYADATQATRGQWEALLYHQALYTAADANAAPVLDLARRWGYGTAPTLAGLNQLYDGVHPTVLGYADIGAFFADFLALI